MSDNHDLFALKQRAANVSITGADVSAMLAEAARLEKFELVDADLRLDFTRHPITAADLEALIRYGADADLEGRRDAMLDGLPINVSENRAVLHARLRDSQATMAVDNVNAMAAMAEKFLAAGIEDVVCIGIGGSALGPEMVLHALAPFHQGPDIHFAASIDPSALGDLLASLNPVTTGFIVTSKSFTTRETLANWSMAKAWMSASGVSPEGRTVAITHAVDSALRHGFGDEDILAVDEAIGGRYSLWSAVGFGIMLAFGQDVFVDMLAGAEAMDRHFTETPLDRNMPMLGGLIRFWHHGLRNTPCLAVIPYESRLNRLPAWLQQLEMESNGKSLGIDGKPVQTGTAPIIFGETGSAAEHSFFQLLHQGPRDIAVDLLAARNPLSLLSGLDEQVALQHRDLLAQMMAQADALATGNPDQGFPGGRPVTVMTWDQTSPFSLGRVLAYYEHVTAVSGWLYGLNSFDQPGVELGKQLSGQYLSWIENPETSGQQPPPSTVAMLQAFRKS